MFLRTLFVVVLVTASAIGCSRRETSRRSGTETQEPLSAARPAETGAASMTLTFPKLPALCIVDWSVAREKGFFAAEGLNLELLPLDLSGGHSHERMWVKTAAGSTPADLMVIEHARLAEVASGELPYYVVAGEHSGCHQLVVPVQSPIRTVADLRGKRIGLPSQEDTGPWEFLARQAGLAPGALQWVRPAFPQGGHEELEFVKREFSAGGIDAFVTTDPVGEILKAEGIVRLVASNTWTPPLNGWYCCMLGVRRDLLNAHPELAKAVTRAIRRSAEFVERQPSDAVALGIAARQLPPDTPRELSARLLKEYVWTGTGRIQDDLERYFQFLIEGGRLSASVSPRDLVKRVYRSGE